MLVAEVLIVVVVVVVALVGCVCTYGVEVGVVVVLAGHLALSADLHIWEVRECMIACRDCQRWVAASDGFLSAYFVANVRTRETVCFPGLPKSSKMIGTTLWLG